MKIQFLCIMHIILNKILKKNKSRQVFFKTYNFVFLCLLLIITKQCKKGLLI